MRTALLIVLSGAIVVGVGANELRPGGFRGLDVDRDGRLSSMEVAAVPALQERARVVDEDGNGYIDEREYFAFQKRSLKRSR